MNSLRTILLAEDNPNDVELTLGALAENNLANDVIVVSDGAEALDYLYRRGKYELRHPGFPAVMLLDIKMPKMDGIEVLRTVKSDPDLKAMPVVMLTSSREESDLIKSYSLGANAFVVKPIDFGDFVKAVAELGVFWALINEPPAASSYPSNRENH